MDVKDSKYRYSIYRLVPRYAFIIAVTSLVVDHMAPLSSKGLLSPTHILNTEKKYGRFNNEIYYRIVEPLKKAMNSSAFSDDW